MLLGLHERAHEVVGRLGAPLREEHVQVRARRVPQRVTNQMGVSPSRPGCRCTGLSLRMRAYVSCVLARNSGLYRS